MKKNKTNTEDQGYFFWLGEDGEMEPVTEDQFEQEQQNLREALEKWKGVNIDDVVSPSSN